MSEHWIAILTLIVLFLTMCVLIWYTYETHQMQVKIAEQVRIANRQIKASTLQIKVARKQIQESKNQTAAMIEQGTTATAQSGLLARQIGLSILPAFSVSVVSRFGNAVMHISILNIGNGIAKNILIDPIDIATETGVPDTNILIPQHAFMRPNEGNIFIPEIRLGVEKWSNVTPEMKDEILLKTRSGKDIKIMFEDIEGNRHEQQVRIMGNGSILGAVRTL